MQEQGNFVAPQVERIDTTLFLVYRGWIRILLFEQDWTKLVRPIVDERKSKREKKTRQKKKEEKEEEGKEKFQRSFSLRAAKYKIVSNF